MSIGIVEFDATNISFTKGRFGCWVYVSSYTVNSSDFSPFYVYSIEPNQGATLWLTYLPSTPTLGFGFWDDAGSYIYYEDTVSLSLDHWYFIELSWNHVGTPSYHLYVGSLERTIIIIDQEGIPVLTGTAEDLDIGGIGGDDVIDIRMQNILFSNLDTRDLYALRGEGY